MEALKKLIREIPDFPKRGILFYDITTLLRDADGFRQAVESMVEPFQGGEIDVVAGIESRGFIFGAAVADRLGLGFVPVRKPGKLPGNTVSSLYSLEYGTDSLEMHDDAISKGDRVLIVDDLLATGGTAKATVELIEGVGAKVSALSFLVELEGLKGRSKLEGRQLHVTLRY